MNTIFVRKLTIGEATIRIAVVESFGMYMVSERYSMPRVIKAQVIKEMEEQAAIQLAEEMVAFWIG